MLLAVAVAVVIASLAGAYLLGRVSGRRAAERARNDLIARHTRCIMCNGIGCYNGLPPGSESVLAASRGAF